MDRPNLPGFFDATDQNYYLETRFHLDKLILSIRKKEITSDRVCVDSEQAVITTIRQSFEMARHLLYTAECLTNLKTSNQEDVMSVGENIRRLREDAGLTQQELADKMGVSRPMIAQIERGTKSVSLVFGAELAREFGCSIDELLK